MGAPRVISETEGFRSSFTPVNMDVSQFPSNEDFSDLHQVLSDDAHLSANSTLSDPQTISENEIEGDLSYVDSTISTVTHDVVIRTAQRLLKRGADEIYDQRHEDFHYLQGPSRKTRLVRYPHISEPLPPNWTLNGLCREYPNHLVGLNLIPFLQHGWTAHKIIDAVKTIDPQQVGLLTSQTIVARIRSLKADMGKKLEEYLTQPCQHEEGLSTSVPKSDTAKDHVGNTVSAETNSGAAIQELTINNVSEETLVK